MPSTPRTVELSIPDFTRGKGDNLGILLGRSADNRTLIIGQALEGWRKIFRNSDFSTTTPPVFGAKGIAYDLVLYHSNCAANRNDLVQQLRALKQHADHGSPLIIFSQNVFSPSRINKIKSRKSLNPGGPLRCSLSGVRRALGVAGLIPVNEFLPLPRLESAAEFVLPASRFLELPHNWHPLLHLGRRLGRFDLFADGIVYIVAPRRIEEGALFDALASQIDLIDGEGRKRFTLERFDLRQRGVLALFLTEKSANQGFIARVVSDDRSGEIVRGNQEFLRALQSKPDLPASIKALLPRPLGDFQMAKSTVYIESLLEGILAWKVDRGRFRDRIFEEACNFILHFQECTKFKVRISNVELAELFDADLARLEACAGLSPELCEGLFSAVKKIRQMLHGREFYLSASHGDYGYGNILVDAGTGRLKGVIDWDTGKGKEIPGVDFLNLKIQRARTEPGMRVSDAFKAVISSTIECGCLDAKGNYSSHFGLSGGDLPILLYLSLLRYLTRAAQYPEVFGVEHSDYLESLNFLTDKVPL